MIRAALISLGLLCLPAVAPGQESTPEPESVASLRLAVAAFEAVTPPDAGVPDVATALVERLRDLGVENVVGPEGLPESAALDAASVRALAERADAEVVVVGRTTRVGSQLSVDVRLRPAATGEVAGTFVAELADDSSDSPALERLAHEIIDAALSLEPVAVAQGSSPGVSMEVPLESDSQQVPDGGSSLDMVAPFGIGSVDDEKPLSIRADELEASDREGDRLLVFRRNVRVSQGEITLRSAFLEAFYPMGASQPKRLVATGDVILRQGDREARCDRAVYERPTSSITCEGSAWLRDGDNRLHGERIVFDLVARRVTVTGGTEVLLHPKEGSGQALGLTQEPEETGSAGEPDEDAVPADALDLGSYQENAPVSIRSARLQAFQSEGERKIVFEREVEVVQAGVTLRADRLQAVYPDGSDQPDRLVATGAVSFVLGDKQAECDEAVYHRPEQRVDCMGSAVLREGDDQVRGDVIAFDLVSQSVTVKGATRLLIGADGSDGGRVLQ